VLCVYATRYTKDRDEARDIVQDCFVKLWERRSTVTEPTLKNYLYTMVRNECLYRIRTALSTKNKNENFAYLQSESLANIDSEAIISSEMTANLYTAIETLPPKIKQVFKLHYVEGKKFTEIAALLHSSYDTVRQQRARGVQILKEKLLVLLITVAYFAA
jgi:RNA polymerase sigma-70 factor (family 1)